MDPVRADILTVVQRSSRSGLWSGLRYGRYGMMLGLPLAAYDASKQRRGERLPTLAGRTLGLMSMPAMAGAFATGLMLVPGIGPAAAGIAGTIAAFYPNARFQNTLARGFRKFSRFEQDVRRLEMGGDFKDSLAIRSSRMAAIQEMNASLVASRRFLGQEAMLYHR